MRKALLALLALTAGTTAFAQLTAYVGRGESFAQPIIDQFTADTGIEVQVRYGSTAELALLLSEEGSATPADVFWAQDAGALGALDVAGVLAAVPASVVSNVPAAMVHPDLTWVAVSARSRVLLYSTDESRVDPDNLPDSIFDLTEPQYAGRVAWAPGNASFQSFVTALRSSHGEDAARAWLEGMIANGAVAYSNNGTQLDAVASGEVDFGLVNNYYLPRRLANEPDFPVTQAFFGNGDIGNMANVTGVGILAASDNQAEAVRLIEYLLSDGAQTYFTVDNFEYPITSTVAPNPVLVDGAGFQEATPEVDLREIFDLPGTLELLTDVGLL